MFYCLDQRNVPSVNFSSTVMQQYQKFRNPSSGTTSHPDLCVPTTSDTVVSNGFDQEMQPGLTNGPELQEEELEPKVEITFTNNEEPGSEKQLGFSDPAGDRYDPKTNVE